MRLLVIARTLHPASLPAIAAIVALACCLALPARTLGAAAERWLDVSITVFDMNLPEDPREMQRQGIYREVRNVEARYIPAYLQRLMVDSGEWGAVRLLPEADAGAELLITGSILHSDGARLSLALRAADSSGRVWIDRVYEGEARPSVSLTSSERGDPFQDVYRAILADLEQVRDGLGAAELAGIRELAFLRYAASLSPESFTEYLQRDDTGRYRLSRLPASNDPILTRVRDIRQREEVFIDVVDQQYREFFQDVGGTYDLWREYRRDQMANSRSFEERQGGDILDFRPGSYRALRERYDNYRWAKLQEQYLDELAEGFSNEIAPTELDLEDRVVTLSGSMEEQYREWREILRAYFELEG